MRVQKAPTGFRLFLDPLEGRLLRQCLSSIHKNYRITPDQADASVVACWYATHESQKAGLSGFQEWQRDLHQLRMANLELVERWQAQLGRDLEEGCELALPLAEAPSFLTVINDHRLLMAARHDIGEEEMELQSLRQISKLSTDRQGALYEIHLLAYLMEELLSILTK